ncbi:hypothetical protein AX17_004174 [Amanita inopinata Kibby_2008]|nr:hypothetical protein AX17_004174 [Amanita inopinata Kibby_2008]
MSGRRIAGRPVDIPQNAVILEFQKTDGDSSLWPTNTTCIVDHGEVNYMRHLDLDTSTSVKWRLSIARAIAMDKGMPESQEYILKDWPEGYRMFDHAKGPEHDPRHDVYLFGSRRGRFRSINEFIPHAIWLMRDSSRENASCTCKYCSKKAQKEITASMSNILRSSPNTVSPTSSRAKSTRDRRPISTRPRDRVRDTRTYAAVQKRPEITNHTMLVERNADLRAVSAKTEMKLKRWFREGEIVWCALDPPIPSTYMSEDASIKFWPALVEETRLKTQAVHREGVSDAYAAMNVDHNADGESKDLVVDNVSSEVPWTVRQSYSYKVQLLAVNRTLIIPDDKTLPYQAHIPPAGLISALQAFPPENLDFSREALAKFIVPTDHPVDFDDAVAPYAMAVQIGAALSGFWSLTDEWTSKFTSPLPARSPLPKPTALTSLQDAIEAANRSNAQNSNPAASSSTGPSYSGLRIPPPGAQVTQIRYQGLWWGGERIWTDEVVRLKLLRRCLAPKGAENVYPPSGPGKTAREMWLAQGRDVSELGAGARGVFLCLDGLIVVDVTSQDGRIKKECRGCGMLYELAELDWEEPNQDEQNGTSQHAPPKPTSTMNLDSSVIISPASRPALVETSPPPSHTTPDAGSSQGRHSESATVSKTHYPLPEAPEGYRFRPILPEGYEAVISLSLISGRYYPRILSHPLLGDTLTEAITKPPEEGGLMDSSNLWALEGLSAGFYNSVDPIHYKTTRALMIEEADRVARQQLEGYLAERIRERMGEDGSSRLGGAMDVDEAEMDGLTAVIKLGKQKSQDDSDLRLLAISTHMTELSYAISDIQTRIFEIQELRHKSHASGDAAGTTSIIDQSLMNLDERLETVEKGMKAVNEAIEPLAQSTANAAGSSAGDLNEVTVILRKHAALVADWDAVQDESEVLREELKEDKWLTVFRTVTDQADGMMSSLEKAVNRCQEFIWQVHKRGAEDLTQLHNTLSVSRTNRFTINLEVFSSLLESYEAKKKHYMPATSKVLSIIDKGVRDRVTKNGETLRRHAESAQRWKNLRERISRTDADMEAVRRLLTNGDATPSEAGSSTSGNVSLKSSILGTPHGASKSSRKANSSNTLSRSISPFRKFARKITGSSKQSPSRQTTPQPPPVTPLSITKSKVSRAPSSEPPLPVARPLRRQRSSIMVDTDKRSDAPETPEHPGHKHSHSLTPGSSPHASSVDLNSTVKSRNLATKQPWNSSTKLKAEERSLTVKTLVIKRSPSSQGVHSQTGDVLPFPSTSTPHHRSISRASMASSRPWSPITSSGSTSMSSTYPPPMPIFRPPSRAQTPSRPVMSTAAATPRSRAKTPFYIPGSSKRSISAPYVGGDEENLSPKSRPFSPTLSASGLSMSSSGYGAPPRPPSRSMIPIPSLHLSTISRPSTSMSSYDQLDSPSSSIFRTAVARAQTPESTLRARVQQVPLYHGSIGPRSSIRPSASRAPPSSFKDGTSSSRTPSRPTSRAGAFTPSLDSLPLHEYVVGNVKDPLDVEVAAVVNGIAHGLLIERVDPALRKIPKEGEEIKAQYAFSNTLSRKIVTCRLTTMTRSGKSGDTITRKVMCRVGGGWQDLSHYILNRQAGM